jgi:hypothetical protein
LSADVDVVNSEELLFVAVEEDNRCRREDVLFQSSTNKTLEGNA